MDKDPSDKNPQDLTSERARELSALGASRGGRARASVLTAEQRSAIAREAVRARWIKAGKLKDVIAEVVPVAEAKNTNEQSTTKEVTTLPFSMFRGKVQIGPLALDCHVLNDGRRVFTQGEMVRAITGGTESSNLARYLRANPLVEEDFSGGPIRFQIPGNPQVAIGSEATLLIEICERYLDARSQGLLKSNQKNLAKFAEIIVRACAKTGIIALIDKAPAYQKVRARNALQIKLQAFIADELQEWAVMFPEEFWIELARLEGIHYSPRNRPLRWGKYVMAFVYDTIDKDMGQALRVVNHDQHFKQNDHQLLTYFGSQHG